MSPLPAHWMQGELAQSLRAMRSMSTAQAARFQVMCVRPAPPNGAWRAAARLDPLRRRFAVNEEELDDETMASETVI